MEKQTFSVPNIACSHCVMSVKNGLEQIDGVKSINSDRAAKTVTVQWEAPASAETIKAKLSDLGYPAT